uniref:Myelin basic protein n=1 Tax=Hucho hucho TaxID=62062 RepID=A0A4W5L8D3_9TELE
MGQHLGKREPQPPSKPSSAEPEAEQTIEPAPIGETMADPESQDEVFGLDEADVNPNNGCPSEKAAAVTDSTGTEGPSRSWNEASTADADDSAVPRPHLVRLFSRDAPGREDNTFKDRPSESDELQTIQEHSGAGSECGPLTWQLQAPLDCLAWEGKRRPLALWIKLGTSLEGTRRGRARVLSVACPPLLPDLPRQPLRVGRTLLYASSERLCPLPLLSLGSLRSQQDPLSRRRPVQETAEPCPRSSKCDDTQHSGASRTGSLPKK